MKIVTITVTKDGQTRVEAHGFKGQGCKAITEAVAHAMGQPTTSAVKAEYWEPDVDLLNQQDLGNG